MTKLTTPYLAIYLEKGADFEMSMLIIDTNKNPRDLSSGNVYGYLRESVFSEDRIPFLIRENELAQGIINLELSRATIDGMSLYNYIYDVFYQDENDLVEKITYGIAKVYP